MKKGYLGIAVLLGLMLCLNTADAKMTKAAHQYYQQASNYHYSKASFMLGYMYHYGDGTSKDLKKAKEYYQLALQDGYLEAQKELDKLEVEK